jgi:hypothetical protein
MSENSGVRWHWFHCTRNIGPYQLISLGPFCCLQIPVRFPVFKFNLPPVLVDMNKDGVKDILMSGFDGTMILFDGETLDVMYVTVEPV